MRPDNVKVLCSISTRGRYDTTLPLAIQSVLMQSRTPDKLVIFDDNDPPKDMREVQLYQYLFMMLDLKGIAWEWVFAEKKGQHFNHDKANKMAVREGYGWVWRLDDDTIAEPNVLEEMIKYLDHDKHRENSPFKFDKVGAVGGAVLTPPFQVGVTSSGKIEDIYTSPNPQWDIIRERKSVDHLHCTFIYKAGVHDYSLELSRVAHREETLFTYGLKQKGYALLLIPNCITWHLRNRTGGIRDGDQRLFAHDEEIFRRELQLHADFNGKTLVVLDCGIGDHIVFKHMMGEIKNPVIFSCYPDVVPGRSIAEAKQLLGDIEQFNVYRKMDEWNWKGSLEDAFRKLYVVN